MGIPGVWLNWEYSAMTRIKNEMSTEGVELDSVQKCESNRDRNREQCKTLDDNVGARVGEMMLLQEGFWCSNDACSDYDIGGDENVGYTELYSRL